MKKIIQGLLVTLLLARSAHADIVVSVPYLKDLVQNITCSSNKYSVKSLIPIGVDPHTFVLTPDDRTLIQKADFVIQIGSDLEPWLDKIGHNKNQTRLNLSEHLSLRKRQEVDAKNNSSLVYDPHIWQSPKLTEDAANLLSQTFIQLFPNEKKILTECTKKYIDNIHTEVAQLKQKSLSINPKNRVIATNHDALGYFAEAFDFKIYSILGLSDEDQPTAKQLKTLIEVLQKQNIKSVFLESTGNEKNIKTVAKGANVTIGGQLYGDSFGEKESGADTTLGMWQTNMDTLVKALK
ncbi:MAG: metal ABC transporter substrate-binding protein [Bdellovibrionota bacterium]